VATAAGSRSNWRREATCCKWSAAWAVPKGLVPIIVMALRWPHHDYYHWCYISVVSKRFFIDRWSALTADLQAGKAGTYKSGSASRVDYTGPTARRHWNRTENARLHLLCGFRSSAHMHGYGHRPRLAGMHTRITGFQSFRRNIWRCLCGKWRRERIYCISCVYSIFFLHL
jgi:hypothetical protein